MSAYQVHAFEAPGDSGSTKFAKWAKRFVRSVYFANGLIMLAALTYLTVEQNDGSFRCNSISIHIADDVWEEAYIKLDDGTYEKRLLIYSHFNGIYAENGTHDGRPKYTEQNKEDGQSFRHTIGAEIIYCEEIEGVFLFITNYLFYLLMLFKLELIALYLLPSLGVSARTNKYK